MRESDLYWWEKLVRKCSNPGSNRLRISRKTCDAILGMNQGIQRLKRENRQLKKQVKELEKERAGHVYPK